MAYVRWSDESDVYCYAHVNGQWAIHIAQNKLKVGKIFDENILLDKSKSIEDVMKEYDRCHKSIGLPYDGQDFMEPTLQKCKERLIFLRKIGYLIPDYAIERIDKEIKENE